MDESLKRLLRARELPNRTPVMHQRWDDLLFLHWQHNADELASHLPPSLSLDLYNQQAYISVVGFRMNAVRPTCLPALPWLSYFYELNVRVYVRDASGEPGVYFLSLDCNRDPAVWIARCFFNLPYKHATMRFDTSGDNKTDPPSYIMTCQRAGYSNTAHYRWRPAGSQAPAEPGSLEFFLTERYNFFTLRRGLLMRGQVYHAPYNIGAVQVTSWSGVPIEWDGLSAVNRPPDIASCSAGVVVRAFSLVPA